MRRRILSVVLPMLGVLAVLQGCGRHETGYSAASTSADAASGHLQFIDVTRQVGLGDFRHETGAIGAKWFPETMGGGAGFIDYDGDEWLDILLVAGGFWPDSLIEQGDAESRSEETAPLRLYRNTGDGTFIDVTERVGLHHIRAYGFGVVAADFDNDGDEDFYLTTLGENMLFRNDGGHFVEIGRQAGVAGPAVWSTSAIFFDADRDGHLDLYVGNYVDWSPENDVFCTVDGATKAYCQPTLYTGLSGNFYHNDGDGTFTEMTDGAGFGGAPGKTLGVAELDFNRDGWPDLVVANDTERDLLFENNGDGTFTENGVLSGIAFDSQGRATGGMGVDVGVVDDTGHESIFIGNFSNEMIGVYRHEGNGRFLDRAAVSKIGRPSLRRVTFGLFLFDADLDGRLDVFAANGNIREEAGADGGVPFRQTAQLFLNQGEGVFEVAQSSSDDALARQLVGRGAAYGDYDRDGDLDLLVVENGGGACLWQNAVQERNALRVRLEGAESNRDGIGAEVEIAVGKNRNRRRVRTGSSYLSQSEKTVTFGLGAAERVDSLIVRWPSGRIDRFANISASPRQIRVVEGMPALATHPVSR